MPAIALHFGRCFKGSGMADEIVVADVARIKAITQAGVPHMPDNRRATIPLRDLACYRFRHAELKRACTYGGGG